MPGFQYAAEFLFGGDSGSQISKLLTKSHQVRVLLNIGRGSPVSRQSSDSCRYRVRQVGTHIGSTANQSYSVVMSNFVARPNIIRIEQSNFSHQFAIAHHSWVWGDTAQIVIYFDSTMFRTGLQFKMAIEFTNPHLWGNSKKHLR